MDRRNLPAICYSFHLGSDTSYHICRKEKQGKKELPKGPRRQRLTHTSIAKALVAHRMVRH
jgi:hypothetical protein